MNVSYCQMNARTSWACDTELGT